MKIVQLVQRYEDSEGNPLDYKLDDSEDITLTLYPDIPKDIDACIKCIRYNNETGSITELWEDKFWTID